MLCSDPVTKTAEVTSWCRGDTGDGLHRQITAFYIHTQSVKVSSSYSCYFSRISEIE